MKNIIRITALVLLVALLVPVCVSCKKEDTAPAYASVIAEMYKNSAPTKAVSKTVQTTGDIVLSGTYTLVTGTIGGKAAAVYEEHYQEMRTVESGGESTTIYDYIKDVHNLYQYVEDKGTRQLDANTHNVISDWNINGKKYAIEQGSFALNLGGNVTGEQYDGTTYTATVPQANTKNVFGYEIAANFAVTVVNNGAQIISVRVEYNLPAEGEVKETHVVMDIEYTYDNERITLD